ncbi:MAG: hypothetical protein ABSE05_07535 [Syntrophales bacterium]|jgi:hypothetical protein
MLIAISIVMTSVPAFGYDEALDATVDILFIRSVSLAATVVGTAVFIVLLPFSILSQSAGHIARTLVAEPFNFTFTKPIGGFSGERMRSNAPNSELQSPGAERSTETDTAPSQ